MFNPSRYLTPPNQFAISVVKLICIFTNYHHCHYGELLEADEQNILRQSIYQLSST